MTASLGFGSASEIRARAFHGHGNQASASFVDKKEGAIRQDAQCQTLESVATHGALSTAVSSTAESRATANAKLITASHSSGAHYRAGRLLLVQSCLLQTLSSQHPLWISITSTYPSVNPAAAVITHMGNNASRVAQPMSQTWCLESKGVCYVLLHCLAPIMKDGN